MLKHYAQCFFGILLLQVVCLQAIASAGENFGPPWLQQQTIRGIVTDEKGTPFPGVNVIVKGTSNGTVTNADGAYSISIPSDANILVFSFVGYFIQEVTIDGKTTVDVSLQPDVTSLDEVVVTALGIERSSKSLGYATSKVNSDQLAINRTSNFMNTLQGKVAGVNITSMSTGPGGSSKVRIRGQSSMSGQNAPLIVVNGVPIDNVNFGTNPGNLGQDNSIGTRGGGATTDGGDAFSSINPDDIESMSVLKGAVAAALYGSRAKDGVIIITTKSRGTSKGIGISYNLNYTNETPLDFTEYQYIYGQGENGKGPASPGAGPNPNSGQWSFGPKIQPGMTQVLFDGQGANSSIPYVAQKGIIKDFYRNGQNITNSVSLSANGDKGGMVLSLANLHSEGITPNNTFDRKIVNMGFGYDLSDRLSMKGSINYSNENTKNPPVVSEQDNSIPTALFAMANTMPLSVLRANAYNAGGGEYNYSRFTNRTNPYWVLDNVKQNIIRDRIFGNVSIKYDLTKWLYVQVRAGQDYWSRDNDIVNLPTGKASLNSSSVYSSQAPTFYNGRYTQETRRFRETNVDFLLSATKTFGDFGVNITGGGNQMKKRMDYNSVQVDDFAVMGLYTIGNARLKDPIYELSEQGTNSLYAAAEVNFKEYVYLNGTIRNDWFSTLSSDKRSIAYPSISASYVFSETFSSKPNWLDFGKLRLGYAEAGSDSDIGPYSQSLFYSLNAFPFGGKAVGNFGNTLPNADLQPMRVKEIEVGMEWKLFNGLLGIDIAAYQKKTFDQIITATISNASGFDLTKINSGVSQNRGLELMVNVVPVSTTNFKWDFTFAGSYNKTKVLSILTDKAGETITVGQHVFNGWLQHIVGQEMSQIVGYGYRRDDGSINPDHKGMIIYSSAVGNGVPLATASPIPFGSALHKWVGGFTNTFTYKGIEASFLIDFKLGGKMLSGTNFNAYRHGLHKETLVGREGGTQDADGNDPGKVVGVGVDPNSNINTNWAPAQNFYSVVRGSGIIEPVVYNSGFWKLRQISIGYDFSKFLTKTPIKGLRLSFVANNVLMLKKWVPNIDPEAFSYTSDNVVGLESPNLPTTRSLGFNLNAKF